MPPTDKSAMQDNKNICKTRRKKKNKRTKEVKMCKLGDCCLKKNSMLVWNRLRIIVTMLGSRGVPSLQSFSSAKRAFVDNTRIIKIYSMV